jgi:glycosyltransferase involved in cell wall biosynthesis
LLQFNHMKVALVHDDLVQWGGAERVLLALSEVFPEAPIFTSLFDRSNPVLAQNFGSKKVVTSFMQNIPGWRGMYKALLPLYPVAFEQFDFTRFDLVISQTTRFAKSIITKPETRHICYMHTPPRFLWNYSGEGQVGVFSPYFSFLRLYDQISANRVDHFVAGSHNAASRIKEVYQEDSQVLQPFVDLERFQSVESFEGGYYLIIARLNKYKRVDIAVEAFRKNGKNLKVVGAGPKLEGLRVKGKGGRIDFLGGVSEETLLYLLAGCRSLIVTAEEDFGLTPLEAQALGKPVLAFRKGGVQETVIEGKTGIFFDQQTGQSLQEGLEKLEKLNFNPEDCKENARKFSKEKFIQKLHMITDTLIHNS